MSAASQRLYSIPRETSRTEPRASAEPSMEEILASIRRIIADDQAHSEPLPDEGVSAETDLDISAITFDDDVLQDVLETAETVADEAPAPAPIEPPQRTPPRPAARAASQPSVSAAPVSETAPTPPAAAAAQTQPDDPAPAARPRAEGPQDRLLSSAADASAASAFQALSSVVLSRSPRTLDDLVQEMLRPLLKAWLDEKLPPLVEKLVQTEIERISRDR